MKLAKEAMQQASNIKDTSNDDGLSKKQTNKNMNSNRMKNPNQEAESERSLQQARAAQQLHPRTDAQHPRGAGRIIARASGASGTTAPAVDHGV